MAVCQLEGNGGNVGIPHISKTGNEKGEDLTSDKEKAEVLAEYFSSVYTKEPDTIWELPTREQGLTTLQINLTEEEIKKILAKIKIDKSPGPDAIHPRILYELREVICKPPHKIFKTSMETGEIPEEWRHANVTAIHKKGSRLIASNYKPVSLTSVVCKTMENGSTGS